MLEMSRCEQIYRVFATFLEKTSIYKKKTQKLLRTYRFLPGLLRKSRFFQGFLRKVRGFQLDARKFGDFRGKYQEKAQNVEILLKSHDFCEDSPGFPAEIRGF